MSFTMVDYSGKAPEVAEASASAASATSVYMDQVAAWLMLLPEKVKHWLITLRAMHRDDIVMWLAALAVMLIVLDVLINRKRVFERVRSTWFSSAGMIIGAIWYVLSIGLKELAL